MRSDLLMRFCPSAVLLSLLTLAVVGSTGCQFGNSGQLTMDNVEFYDPAMEYKVAREEAAAKQ